MVFRIREEGFKRCIGCRLEVIEQIHRHAQTQHPHWAHLRNKFAKVQKAGNGTRKEAGAILMSTSVRNRWKSHVNIATNSFAAHWSVGGRRSKNKFTTPSETCRNTTKTLFSKYMTRSRMTYAICNYKHKHNTFSINTKHLCNPLNCKTLYGQTYCWLLYTKLDP